MYLPSREDNNRGLLIYLVGTLKSSRGGREKAHMAQVLKSHSISVIEFIMCRLSILCVFSSLCVAQLAVWRIKNLL